MEYQELLEKLTPEIYSSMKTALELGKWPDGRKLSKQQKEITLQALIAWEIKHGLPEEQRIGFIAKEDCGDKDAFEPINFIDK